MYGKKYMGMLRSTFIVDPKGKIARVFPKVQPKKHDALVLKALAELVAAGRESQVGLACANCGRGLASPTLGPMPLKRSGRRRR